MPDVTVLCKMCAIFGITLNDMVSEEEPKRPINEKLIKRNHDLITIMSVGAVWLVATILFALLMIVCPDMTRLWLSFIYAVPVSSLVFLVFACIWGRWWYKFLHMSVLMWTLIVSLCITFNALWEFLIVGVPLQCLAILWAMLERNIRRRGKSIFTRKHKQNKLENDKKETENTINIESDIK